MVARELLSQCRALIGGDAAEFEARQLFSLLGFSFNPLTACTPITDAQAQQLLEAAKRLAEGYPLQYLLGEWEFYSLPLVVGEGVLIPRPDTEVVAEQAILRLQDRLFPVVADCCAGSGALALAIAAQNPLATVHAVELYPAAYQYLTQNIQRNCLQGRVLPLQADVVQPLSLPPLDLLVSNPPYLTQQEMTTLSPQVQAEPATALYGGADGLDFYRVLAQQAVVLLKRGGWIVLEIGWMQSAAVEALLAEHGFCALKTYPDLGGNPRCVCGQRPL